MVKCSLCNNCNFVSVEQLRGHINISHGNCQNLRFSCGEDGCHRSFDSWRVFRNHLVNHHKAVQANVNSIPKVQYCDTISEMIDCDQGFCEEDGINVSETDSDPSPDFYSVCNRSVEVLVAKLYKNPSLPRNFVQMIIDDIDVFLNSGFIDILESKIFAILSPCNVDQSAISEIRDSFKYLKEPFKGLESDFKRMQHFESSKYYVAPVTYTISSAGTKTFNSKNGPVVKSIKATGQFIPIRKVLKNLFELPGALTETLKFMDFLKGNSEHAICNVIQGEVWQRKVSSFKESDILIPLNFYYDEVEANAALGPHSDKLGAGYILIPVLPPACQSKLENILLALLINSDDRKSNVPGKISFNKEVFQPLIKELNFLEKQGILCLTSDLGEKRLFFILLRVLGDNLGLHGLLGFTEGFTANFPCVICRAPKELTSSMTEEDQSLLRTYENYEADVITNDMSLTGIKELCVFNEVRSFHVIDNLMIDAMHDGPEGMSHYVLIPVLKHCIVDAKFFSLSTLNSQMYYFDYGPSDSSNKPVPIGEGFASRDKLKGTAREILSLVRLLGIFVGEFVPESDEFWRLYLLHKEIIEISQAKELSLEVPEQYGLLVHEHHSLFKQLTGRHLPPKGHHYVHGPGVMKKFGPQSHFSAMRGEAKHREVVTKYARAITSRKNLPLSVAIKHQLTQCLRFISKGPLIPVTEFGPVEVIELEEYVNYSLYKKCFQNLLYLPQAIERVNWVSICGTTYKLNAVLVISVSHDSMRLKFGKVKDIIVVQNKPLFFCNVLSSVGYNEHVGGYGVEPGKTFICIEHEALLDPFPVYDFATSDGSRYVVLKHYI